MSELFSSESASERVSIGTSPTMTSQEAAFPLRRVGPGFILAYVIAYFGAWIAFLTPIVVALAIRIQQIDPAGKVGDIALITGVGAVFGFFSSPFFGKMSDRTASRLGMRRPWLIAGVIGTALGLLIVAFAQTIPILLLGWCITNIAFWALAGVLVAVLPDQVPEEQRGLVSGLLGMCQQLAIIGGVFLAQLVAGSTFWMFMLPAGIALVTVLVFTLVLKDRTLDPSQRPPYSLREILRSFWVNPVRYPDFGWAYLSRFLLFLALATLLDFQVYYLIDHLHEAPTVVVGLVLIATVIQTVCVVLSSTMSGVLSDRAQRRKIFVMAAALIYAIGLLTVAFTKSFTLFVVAVAIVGIGQGAYVAVDLALGSEVLPDHGREAAKDMAVFNCAAALPPTIAPAIALIFLGIGGGNNYTALFIAAAVYALLGALAIQPVKGVR
jgi:MFS family permease